MAAIEESLMPPASQKSKAEDNIVVSSALLDLMDAPFSDEG